MVVRRMTYPQVDPRAAGLMTRAIAVVPAALPIAEAARLVRRRSTRLLVARLGAGWGGMTPETLEHALRLGLGAVSIQVALWEMPRVRPDTPEIAVRRALGAATPFVLVVDREGPLGAVLAEPESVRALPLSVADRVARLPDAVLHLLRRAGALGERQGQAVYLVGGLARDLLRDAEIRAPVDVDLAVEADARGLARGLAREFGEARRDRVREHAAFLTATVDLPDGSRVDVATTRRETYRAPGVLPDVEPAPIASDLWRRDVSVNALAIRLDGPGWGQVFDPSGGLDDVRRRRIRVLHPLSLVEDPTRVFRAVRFAVRLGFRLAPTTRHLLSQAVRLSAYDALSGDRLRAEFRLALAEPDPRAVLTELARRGAFRVLLPQYRFHARAERLLERAFGRTRGLPLALETREALCVLALTTHLAPGPAAAWLARLGLPGPVRAAIEQARSEAGPLIARLARLCGPGEAYAALRRVPELVAAWGVVVASRPQGWRPLAEYLGRWRQIRPLLTGDDLQALGLAPGPAMGTVLSSMIGAQVAGQIRDRAEALAWAREALDSQSNPTG